MNLNNIQSLLDEIRDFGWWFYYVSSDLHKLHIYGFFCQFPKVSLSIYLPFIYNNKEVQLYNGFSKL